MLTALGVLRQIDRVLGEEHTLIEYLKQEMAAGRKQVPSSGILIGLLVADMLAYPKRIARVYEVQTLAKAWHTDKLLGIDPDLLNDDRLLRALSKLGVNPSDMRDILQGTTLNVSDRFKIGLSRFFVDGSILQLRISRYLLICMTSFKCIYTVKCMDTLYRKIIARFPPPV
ncbi:MAG: hypothetical protein QMC95_17375 [Desulfitobacteriaceae bacterium]|nr:hypothetical protein [Desulfitobacteriaceae bacterium]MDI6915955.1 hypothetical protein [Desulfitobacteriaceae bacterium]